MIRILIIEDDENKRTDIENVLERNGIHKPSYISHDNIQDGLNSLKEIKFDILILIYNCHRDLTPHQRKMGCQYII
jgi:DNA-binding response OmpR family regulator